MDRVVNIVLRRLPFVTAIILIAVTRSLSQPSDFNKDAILKSVSKCIDNLKVGYRYPNNSFTIVTIRFKLTEKGTLDSLQFSANAPQTFMDSARSQLIKQNDRWTTGIQNSNFIGSKWFITRYYLKGYISGNDNCNLQKEADFMTAYERDQDLFKCYTNLNEPYHCDQYYLEGSTFYLFPPHLFQVKR